MTMSNTALRRQRTAAKGKIQKKNSMYFKAPEFVTESNTDLRALAHKRLQQEDTLKKKQGSLYKLNSRLIKKNSIYVEGTLEHKLSSLMDLAYLDLSGEGPTEEELENKRKAKEDAYNNYLEMKSSPTYENLQNQFKAKAIAETEASYIELENELLTLEKQLGLDKVTSEEFKKQQQEENRQLEQLKSQAVASTNNAVTKNLMTKFDTAETKVTKTTKPTKPTKNTVETEEDNSDDELPSEFEDDNDVHENTENPENTEETPEQKPEDNYYAQKGIVGRVIQTVTETVSSYFPEPENIDDIKKKKNVTKKDI